MTTRGWRRFYTLAFVLSAWCTTAWGQTAQINGEITDSTGAVVPQVEVNALNAETGIRRRTVSNDQGFYAIPRLKPGTYTLTIDKAGFRPITRSGIKLEIQQAARIDFRLELGEVAESINVEAGATLLQASDTSQGQVIANKQIIELPLNGRNYTQLILLSNGAAEAEPGTRGSQANFSSNGQRSYQNNFILDSADNNSNLLALQSDDFEVIRPNIDAIQEFKVQTNAYSAEYGRGAGAIVNVAIKSGTNQFHGTTFEFLRNDKIEANDFFNNRSGSPRQAFRQNQFGGALGGPIKRERAFFFGDYQGTRIRRAARQLSRVPTALERRGDFSQTLLGGSLQQIFDPQSYDPQTGARSPFPGNLIPANRIEPISPKLVDLYPTSNTTVGIANFLSNFPKTDDTNQFDLRGDLRLSDSDQLFARVSYQDQRVFNPPPLPGRAVGGNFTQGPRNHTGHSGVFGETHIFGPNLVATLRLAYSRVVSDWASTNQELLNQEFGIKGTPPDLPGLSEMSISGYAGIGDPGFLPNLTKANNYELAETVNWHRSRHDFAFGAAVRHVQSTLFTVPQTRGSFNFAGNFSRQTKPLGGGNGLADFLLGIPTTATISSTSQAFYLRTPFAVFAQDSWRISTRLTLNLGIRYERIPWYHERYGNIANVFFDGSTPRLLTPKGSGVPGSSLVETDNINFAPRMGFAYQVTSKMVIRAGYGLFYGAEEQIGGGPMLQNNPPFNVSSSFVTDNITPNLLLGSGFPAGAATRNPQRPNVNSFALRFPGPYSQQWNLTLERQLTPNLMVSVGYVGSTSTHLYQSFPINAPPPAPGNLNDRRPIQRAIFPVLGLIPIGGGTRVEPRGLANFHSLQSKIERRFSSGIFFLASWVYSKAIDYSGEPLGVSTSGSVNNPFDLSQERALAPFDVRHRFVFSYGYELPFGRGRSYLNGLPRALDHGMGGWQVQGITTVRMGMPFTVTATGNASNTVSADRPDIVGDPRLTSDQQTVDRFFNTSAFRRQAAFTFGNAGRNILTGPALVNFDFSIFKNFALREGATLQFRSEIFNWFNTPSFGFPGGALGTATFGAITSTTVPPRQFQFALKLVF